jgi:uncharacterized protein
MQCPYCNVGTRQIERLGVLLETCPTCKGAWLEAADLERILNVNEGRGELAVAGARRRDRDSDERGYRDRDGQGQKGKYDSDSDDGRNGRGYGRQGRKRGLARLFDIFD